MNRKEGRIPIAKNTDSEQRKTVRILDGEGNQIGFTYPKRAAGLVKKGRAYYVNDFIIHLTMSDAMLPDNIQKSEVLKMDQSITIETANKETENQVVKLYFDPRKWSFNKTCKDNVGNRSFITGPDGVLAEGYMIGDWSNRWTEIVSETLLLPKNADCSFTFWLNGGENDRNDEVCRFDIIFNNNHEQRFSYNLNRNYIRPVKKLNGWELYEIPFRTENNEYTELRFVAQKAYMTVLAAKDVSFYKDVKDHPDPFEAERPQRHNIIFSDGFPANSWYSTRSLKEKHKCQQPDKKHQDGFGFRQGMGFPAMDLGIPPIPSFDPSINMPENQTTNVDTSQITASIKNIFDKMRADKYVSIDHLEGEVENSGEQAREIIGNALQKLNAALQQVTQEIQAKAEKQLDAISTSLESLSSACDMLEDLNVESLAGNIKVTRDEAEDLDDILSDMTDSISDIADDLRNDIEEISDHLDELRDSLSM